MNKLLRLSADFKMERETQLKRHKRVMLVWSGVVLFISMLIAFYLLNAAGARNVERRITWPLQFLARDRLEKAPRVDERLHVIMYDDSTAELFKRASLNLREWGNLLTYLDKHKPASIYIDKMFGILDDDVKTLQDTFPLLQSLRSRVSVGAFTTPNKIPGRDQLDIASSAFRARNYLSDPLSDISDESLEKILTKVGLHDRSKAFVYGPMAELRTFFQQGHIDYARDNEIYPLYRLKGGKGQQVLPTLSLSGRINLKIEANQLSAYGATVPLLSDGALLVNWLKPEVVYARASTIASAFEAMNSGKLWSRIPENAHIVILPLAFTGNADFKNSPYGFVFGGVIHVSVLNSALTKQWISELRFPEIYMLALILLVASLQLVRGVRAWMLLLALTLAVMAVSLHLFVEHAVDVPWLILSGMTVLSGVSMFSVRSLWEMRRDRLLQSMEVEFERVEKEEKRLAKEIADAERIALALKPEAAPEWPDYWISSFHKSVSEASGDWYFFERSQSGRYGHFVLCDITGHGVQAALVVSSCKTILSAMRIANDALFESASFIREYADRLNRILYMHGQGSHSTTLVAVTFDFEKNRMYSLDCGHPFPIWHSTSDLKKWIAIVGKLNDPLGFSEIIELNIEERSMNVGDVVIVHSDGIPLSKHRRILKRYFEELDSGILIPAKRLYDATFKEIARQSTVTEHHLDDVSLVVFRRQE